MADLNDFLIMLGEIRSDVRSINEKIDGMQVVTEDYKSWKNRLIGICVAVSGGFSAASAYLSHLWKN